MIFKKIEKETELVNDLLAYAACGDGAANSKHACVIVNKRGVVLGTGRNSKKTSPLQLRYAKNKFQSGLHAEIEALSRASRRSKGDLTGCTAYVVRSSKLGKPALSRPCEGCSSALYAFGIKEVYYT